MNNLREKYKIISTGAMSRLSRNAWLYRRDLGFLGLFLLFNTYLFAVFDPVPVESISLGALFFLTQAIVLGIWLRKIDGSREPIRSGLFRGQDILALGIILAATIFVFYPLTLMRFDTGTDLSVALGIDEIWFQPWAALNRPLASLGPFIAMHISNNGLGGFFAVSVFSRFAIGALLFGLFCLMLPNRRELGLATAILYVLGTSELARYNLWSIYYQVAVLFFIGSSFLFVYSYLRQSRFMLVAACVSLGASFLQYEHAIAIAPAIPLLLLIFGWRPQLLIWIFAWMGTWAIFTSRLLTYILIGPPKYQTVVFNLNSGDKDVGFLTLIFDNLALQMKPLFNAISDLRFLGQYPDQSIVILLCVFAAMLGYQWMSRKSVQPQPGITIPLLVAAVGAVFSLLGIVVYLPFPVTTLVPDYGTHPTMRYQFFAAPGHAIFWGSLVVGVASMLHNRVLQKSLSAVLIGGICAANVAHSIYYQDSGGALNPYYSYKTASHVLSEIDRQIPKTVPADDIFLELPDSDNSPIGWNYTGFHWSCRLFGIPMRQGRFNAKGIRETRIFSYPDSPHHPSLSCKRSYWFRVTESGDVSYQGILENESESAPACIPCVLKPYPRKPGEQLPFVSSQK